MHQRARTGDKKAASTPRASGAPNDGASAMASLFSRFARATSRMAGRPMAFAFAVLLIVGWAAVGPLFGFSEAWQLVVNTTTTIVTFLMVFLMQSTQNRDTEALQLKISELIRAVDGADDRVIGLEEADENEVAAVRVKTNARAGGAALTPVADPDPARSAGDGQPPR